jgi:hypothetical protein
MHFNPTLFIPGTMHVFFNPKHWWGYLTPEYSNAGLHVAHYIGKFRLWTHW